MINDLNTALGILVSLVTIVTFLFYVYKKKQHPLYKDCLFLDKIVISNEQLPDSYYKNINTLIKDIEYFLDGSYYANKIKKLLPTTNVAKLINENMSMDLYEEEYTPYIENLKVAKDKRQKIIGNRKEVKKLILKMLSK